MHTELHLPVAKSVIYANSVGTQRKLFSNVQLAAILMLKHSEKFQMEKHKREENDLQSFLRCSAKTPRLLIGALLPFTTLDVSGHLCRLADRDASEASASYRCGLRSPHSSFTAQIMALCNCLTSFDSCKHSASDTALPMNKYVAVRPPENLNSPVLS